MLRRSAECGRVTVRCAERMVYSEDGWAYGRSIVVPNEAVAGPRGLLGRRVAQLSCDIGLVVLPLWSSFLAPRTMRGEVEYRTTEPNSLTPVDCPSTSLNNSSRSQSGIHYYHRPLLCMYQKRKIKNACHTAWAQVCMFPILSPAPVLPACGNSSRRRFLGCLIELARHPE
jgi:hypothetical protein